MATPTPRFGFSKPAAGDQVSAFQGTISTDLQSIDGVLWRYRGAWNSATSYAANDVVAVGGQLYLAILASVNFTPPNASYWVPLGGASIQVVNHGADSLAARPAGAAAVYWIGSVVPTNALDFDLFYDTSA